MPAQSKSQQRFFGVVKAMQKGDIPKTGKAGKIAKTMDKDDVDDFASTKHKGKPEKVKREQRVRNLIKKMVREELAQMDEKVTGQYKVSPKVQMHWGMDKVVIISGRQRVVLTRKELKDLLVGAKRNRLTASYQPKEVTEQSFAGVSSPPQFSSPEAKKVVDDALRNYSKDLRKLQGRVVKDWMSKAKSGVIDFFDLVRGFNHGDSRRAYPYEIEFLQSVLTKDKIVDRFRKYFGGKKAMNNRTTKK